MLPHCGTVGTIVSKRLFILRLSASIIHNIYDLFRDALPERIQISIHSPKIVIATLPCIDAKHQMKDFIS